MSRPARAARGRSGLVSPVRSPTWSSWFVDSFLHTPWPAASEHTHARAELDAQREMHRAKAEERDELDAAAREVVDAVEEHQTFVRDATSAQTEADRIRRQADSFTNEADLP